MFTCTVCVSAGVVEVPVIVSVAGPFGVPGFLPPLQPASVSKSTIAVTIPSRMRICCVLAKKNISSIARRTGTTCRMETGGGGILAGGTMNAVVASDTCAFCAVFPSAAATDVGVTVQVERFGAPVQVNATAPVNPLMGVMVTLKLSVLPAVTFCVVVGPVNPKSGGVVVPVSDTVCAALVVFSGWLAKLRLVGASPTAGVGFAPVPVSAMFCGLVLSPSVRTSVAVSAAATDGLNVTLTVQEAPAAMLVPQPL